MKKLAIILLILLIVWISWKISSSPLQNSHIHKVIKTHNGIKETNKSFPTTSNPPSSLIGIVGGDSVRVIPLNPTK